MLSKKTLKIGLHILIGCLLTFGSCDLLIHGAHRAHKITVTDPDPKSRFSFVVVAHDEADIIFLEDQFAEFTAKHPDWSYFVPPDQLDRVRDQIISIPRKGYADLEAENLGPNHQMIDLLIMGDPHSEEYWYEVNDKQITLRAYRFENAFQDLWIPPVSLLVGLFIYFLGRTIIKFCLELRKSA